MVDFQRMILKVATIFHENKKKTNLELNLKVENLKRKFVDCDTFNVKKLKSSIHETAIQKVSYLYADSTLARNKIQLFIDAFKDINQEIGNWSLASAN